MVRKGNKNHKQEKTANLNILFNGRNKAISFMNDYGSMILEAKKRVEEQTKGTGLKILTPKQMIQRSNSSCTSKS